MTGVLHRIADDLADDTWLEALVDEAMRMFERTLAFEDFYRERGNG